MQFLHPLLSSFFFFNDTATTEIYTLSLHDALPICRAHSCVHRRKTDAHHSKGVGPCRSPVFRPRFRSWARSFLLLVSSQTFSSLEQGVSSAEGRWAT